MPDTDRELGFTAGVVAEVRKISSTGLSELVRERTRHAVLDWLGVAIAGTTQDSARIVRELAVDEGGLAVARVLGTPYRLTARQAALAMGVASHALDFDDIGPGGHPSVVTLPAVFAVADELGLDGKAVCEAIVCGYQAMELISYAVGWASYDRGLHLSSHLGAFGATMAVGLLMELDDSSIQQALGIGGTMAAGLKAGFGTMSKALNAGNAAAIGVLAARLAARGFTGGTDMIESPQGFASALNGTSRDLPAWPDQLGAGPLAVEKIIFKMHASCGGSHSAIEGIRSILDRRPFEASEIDEVELVVCEQLPCGIASPQTGIEGLFSVRYAAALVLAGRSTGPSAYTDELVRDPSICAIRDLVTVRPDNSRIPDLVTPTQVKVRLKSGETLSASVAPFNVASDDQLPSQWERLESKFRDLVDPILGEARSAELVELVRSFDSLENIRELADRTIEP